MEQRTPLAERNRRAKMRFLAGIKKHYEAKRQTSMESLNSTTAEPKKVDLTVPGTPVSSRYLSSLSRPESDTEMDSAKGETELPNEIVVSSLVIDRFLKDMKGLGVEEQAQVDGEEKDGEEELGEAAQEYFKESDQQRAYQRSFSKAAQTLHTAEVKSPVVKRYFEESSAKQSYSREFSEAVNELDPVKVKEDPLVDDSKSATRGYKSSVPGTPISSKLLHKLKNSNYISDSSDDEGDGPTSSTALADPLDKFIKDMEQLKALKESNMAKIEKQPLIDFSVDEYLESSKEAKTYARSFSQAVQTLNASEVKNPVIKDYFDQSEEMKTFRREFSEVYQELSEKPTPTKVDAVEKKVEKVERKVETKPDEALEILKQVLETKFEPPKLEKREFKDDFSVDAYLDTSETKKTYARTFSEAAQTLHSSDVKNPAVREYFDQSEAKQSFRREFSEVYQEVLNVTEFARDVVAEKSATVSTKTTASSDQQQQEPQQAKDNEQSAKSISRSGGDEDGSAPAPDSELAQYKRSVSVPGTPINSRKLFPKHNNNNNNSSRCATVQSNQIVQIEAIEACRWLRAAGFPQYAQMYEDHQFPIEINDVAKDHPFLENDPLQSLYRRLQTLNRCANMHIDTHQHSHPPKQSEDSDDDSCALSEAWTFAHNSRRWSRVEDAAGLVSVIKQKHGNKSDVSTVNETDSAEESSKSGSKTTTTDDKENWGDDGVTLSILSDSDTGDGPVRLRRTGSERLKDGAKALLRRVESIKSRRRKRQNRDGLVLSGPHSSSLSPVHHPMDDLKHMDLMSFSNPSSPRPSAAALGDHRRDNNTLGTNEIVSNLLSPYTLSPFGHMAQEDHGGKKEHKRSTTNRSSPLHFFIQLQEAKSGDDSSSICSEDSQDLNTGYFAGRVVKTPSKKYPKAKKLLRNKVTADDSGALSDSEYQSKLRRAKVSSDLKETSSNTLQVSKLNRGGSLNLGKNSKKYRDAFHNRSMRVAKTSDEKGGGGGGGEDKKRPTVARWHSFQQPKNSEGHRMSIVDFKDSNAKDKGRYSGGTTIYEMSCGQLLVVRKLALVTLTGCMERYCPTHRSGWNWELPKFIKRIKTPDYKDRRIFGIPLVLNLQRYGNTLPEIIQMALTWLEQNALDQVGLFRKPGVKSRIAKLKSTVESCNNVSNRMDIFDDHHAYDVADMLKQYFRELPDPLLTAKLSETFVAIFQHLPVDVRYDAVQSAILLLPDEHREVLYTLLCFLGKVVSKASQNQMTANNLAVCLAPSLFYSISGSRSSTASPRRKKGATGQPDEKELNETRASHDCLAYLIQNYRTLWTISSERMRKCSFNYMEESKPVPLESLGAELHVQNWRGYLTECIKECVREGKERPRGWVSLNSADPSVTVYFKKVGDGHPLRLWKTVTEVEAPPTEVINHILNERHLWDDHLLKSRTVERLDGDTDVFQYVCGQPITDYCVLRQWNTQQSRGTCVIVEVSISHNGAQLLLDGVRGVVLASRYLIEPCGSGKCKLMHLSRVDMKGRTPDWYNKNYGHICQQYLSRIKKFFEHYTEGPESKV
ncbi:hypothetical protein pipiens_015291 [Culex pipiens pipiens]|uniref:Rho GTPase-activating protein 7 n=1 Tax=Culex pipiens pipiens TaxID=38569 RepID=A0ABD1CR47_CULPP